MLFRSAIAVVVPQAAPAGADEPTGSQDPLTLQHARASWLKSKHDAGEKTEKYLV